MRILRKYIDQIFDLQSKKELKNSFQLLRQENYTKFEPLGSGKDFSMAHDLLINELSKIGKATENSSEHTADFILDRLTGDQSYIGVICEHFSAKVIFAVSKAQERFTQPYPVLLDYDEVTIAVFPNKKISGSSHSKKGEQLLKKLGFSIN